MTTEETAIPPADQLPDMPADAVLVKEGRVPAPRGDRELEKAPKLLQNAAWVLAVGAAFPFMSAGGGWMSFGLAKVLGVLGCLVLAASVFANTDKPVPYGLDALAKIRWAPKRGEKPKNAIQGFLMQMPTALHLVGLLLLVAAVVLPFVDPVIAAKLADWSPDTLTPAPADSARAAAEVLALLLGGCTLAHVFAYKKGGHFSPLYPFLFLGPLAMGAMAVLTASGPMKIFAIVGGAIVTIGAAIGVYTIVVAMIQAKKEGDAKKAAALEARKAARAARGGSGSGARRS
ncbi:MAG: hypothetical protein R3F34_00095 [Planctomycetota bacterium]